MKRRTFSLLAGSSMLALANAGGRAFAQAAYPQASDFAALSKTTLTPMGAERAGNAAGTIPAWTGGMTEVPAGVNWDPANANPPDFFADEQPSYEVSAANMSQYAAQLSDGVQYLIQNLGFIMKVYPTHRTAAMPQWVYDNIATNATNAKLNPGGGRLGFTGAYGGKPFPVPDMSDPLAAGAMLIWNHLARWTGEYQNVTQAGFVVQNGVSTLSQVSYNHYMYPFFKKDGDVSTYSNYFWKQHGFQFSPATVAGDEALGYESSDPLTNPNIVWQYLNGQGRVRKAPEVSYDTPNVYTNGASNYDELFGFYESPDRYDWKCLGKQEMLVPYNNNKILHTPSAVAHTAKFMNPDVIRWELHRVWIVEATLHPGDRNTLARRRFYFDEDTGMISITDAWDGNNKILRSNQLFVGSFPNLPGTILLNNVVYNFALGVYATNAGTWGDAPYNAPINFDRKPDSLFNPQSMAAAAAY